MQHLFQSTFLQALGFAIANSLWQTALVWLLFMCVNSLSLPAAVKYRFAVAAQLTSFIWFMITLQFYYTQCSEAWQHSVVLPGTVQNIQAIAPLSGDLSSQLINLMVKVEQLLPYVSLAYLLLMLFLCIRWLLGYRHTQLLRKQGIQKIPVEWRLFVKRISAQLGIKKDIRLFLSDVVTTPMTFGFLKPIILIPIASINHLTTEQLEAVILHELAHIKRYDYLINMVLSVVELGLFFNPFTQLLSKSIQKERENSCDDWVLQFQYNASAYAEALLRIAYLQSVPAFAMAAVGKKNDLLIRVKRMIEKKENRFSYRKQLLAFVIVTGLLSSIAWLNPIAAPHKGATTVVNNQPAVKKTVHPFAVEPMVVSVNNPLFNPVFFLSQPLKNEINKSLASAREEIYANNPENIKGNKGLIEFIPSMVAGALEQASMAISEKNVSWEKELAKMEFAKINMEKAFRFDSASIPKNLRASIKEDLARSLRSMETDIAKARIEMNKALKIKADIYIDQEKIKKDLKNAWDELSKLGLEKLVFNALQVPGLLLKDEEHNQHLQKLKPAPKDREKISTPPLPDDDLQLKDKMMADNSEDEDGGADVIISSDQSAKLSTMPNQEKTKEYLLKIIRLKGVIRELQGIQPKLIPVVFKKRNSEEKQIVIQLQ